MSARNFKYHLRLLVEDEYLGELYLKEHNSRTVEKIESDAGFDLFIPEDTVVPKHTHGTLIDLKVKCEMLKTKCKKISSDNDQGIVSMTFFNVSYDLRARSSIRKTPLMLCNGVGTIDAGYRGNIMAAVNNFSDEDILLKKGERYFQLVAPALSPFDISFVYDLSKTARGEGGFGSTGK